MDQRGGKDLDLLALSLGYSNHSLNCQDEKLRRLVEIHGERWDFIASHFADRADVQCQHRWSKVVNPELVKGKKLFRAFLFKFKYICFPSCI